MENYSDLPKNIVKNIFQNYEEFVIFETLKFDKDNTCSYIFISPVEKLVLSNHKEIRYFFDKLEEILKRGFYLTGFFSYELGYFLDYKENKNIEIHLDFPLAYFFVFDKVYIYNHKENKFIGKLPDINDVASNDIKYKIDNISLNVSEKEYIDKIKKIKNYIKSGDVYQINYTVKQKFQLRGSVLGLYYHLTQTQRVSYASFFKTKDFTILSFSPELFFRKNDTKLTVKPMKGTAPRGKNIFEDALKAKSLFLSKKNRAENIMIVDLLRNDLGKLSDYGEVKVESLFDIEKYETLFQMTSTISARIKRNIDLYKLFYSLFPSGSVTGAPKIRAMQIIKELEKEPRRIYTGSIGFITPSKDAVFNVAIRTLLIYKNGEGELGIGSGIVVDSSAKKEFEECKLKSNFLAVPPMKFKLIETMLFCKNFNKKIEKFSDFNLDISEKDFKYGIFLLEFHLKRLKNSALYFDFKFNEEYILEKLKKFYERLNDNSFKIRALLSKDGKLDFEVYNIEPSLFFSNKIEKISVSEKLVDENQIFLYHKTTNRRIFDLEWQKYFKNGYFDVVFLNKNGCITEATRTNIFLKINKIWYTPKISCGLLPGTMREFIINKNPYIKQTELTFEDLKSAEEILLSNSVIGLRKARLL